MKVSRLEVEELGILEFGSSSLKKSVEDYYEFHKQFCCLVQVYDMLNVCSLKCEA
ncbi:hypothetical protein TNCT_252661, partial [Trichonephila clavata]